MKLTVHILQPRLHALRECAALPGGLPLIDHLENRRFPRVHAGHIAGAPGRLAAKAGRQRKPGIVPGRSRAEPLGIFRRRFRAHRKPAEHAWNQVARVEELVLQPVERLALAEAGIPRFAPVVTGGDVPGEMTGIAGVVNDAPSQLRLKARRTTPA